MTRTRAWLFALLASTQLTGFFCVRPSPPPEPCEMDPLGCDPETMLELDPDCTRADPLVLSLGEGETDFSPLSDEHWPETHYGFQGGQHFFLGVELDNPEFDSPGLEIHFVVRVADGCPEDAPVEACAWTTFGDRELVTTDPDLLIAAGERLRTTGYVVVLDEDPNWQYDTSVRVEVSATVRDACDRSGSSAFTYVVDPSPVESSG